MKHWTEYTEEDLSKAWDIHWYWEWLINNKWPKKKITQSLSAVSVQHIAPMLKERGIQFILDVTSGFGLKTVLLQQEGFQVYGSDISAVAVNRARKLAERENLNLDFIVSAWSTLKEVWGKKRFDCVFCDALSWTPNDKILMVACKNFFEMLNEGGILLWAGARKGDPDRDGEELAQQEYKSESAFRVEGPWSLGNEGLLTRVICRELAGEGVVVHRVYVIAQGDSHRIEVSSIVEPTCWAWNRIWSVLQSAGFTRSETVETAVNEKKRLHNITHK